MQAILNCQAFMELPDVINRFEHIIVEVKTWMKINKLKLKDEKKT